MWVFMEILSIYIDGFKNLNKVRLVLDKITALLSVNNFGKSNLLEGVEFGITFIRESSANKKRMMSHSGLIPLNRYNKFNNFLFSIECLMGLNDKKYYIQYGYEFQWNVDKNKEPSIINEYLKIKGTEKQSRFSRYIIRTLNKARYKSKYNSGYFKLVNIENTELLIKKLRNCDNEFLKNISNALLNIQIYMENNLDVKQICNPNPLVIKFLDEELVNIENLPQIIGELQQDHPDFFELLKDVYKQLFPEILDVEVNKLYLDKKQDKQIFKGVSLEISDVVYVLRVKIKNLIKPISFNSLSDGAKRVFLILTRVVLSDINDISIIAIEEPENSVHPRLFQSYLRIISSLIDNCKIIITTHSPYTARYLKPSCLRIGIDKHEGVAEFYELSKQGCLQLEKDVEGTDLSIGDYLFMLMSDHNSEINEYLCE